MTHTDAYSDADKQRWEDELRSHFEEPSERFHGLRWRWRYYVVWRLIGRKGPL